MILLETVSVFLSRLLNASRLSEEAAETLNPLGDFSDMLLLLLLLSRPLPASARRAPTF